MTHFYKVSLLQGIIAAGLRIPQGHIFPAKAVIIAYEGLLEELEK